jgi:hypothetical protein
MPLTPNLSLNRPPHGDYIDTWEGPVNQNWDIVDALFSGSAPTGHTHDGTAGMGPKIDHLDLLNGGTKTHSELDGAFGKGLVSATDTTPDFLELKIIAGTNVTINKLSSPGNEQLEIDVAAVAATLGDGSDPSGEYGWKHFVPTSAPVAYTDNFNYPQGFTLRQADYTVDRTSSGSVLPDFFSTGYSAALFVDPSQGDDPVGKYAATVTCQVPHGVAQRATASITDIDYSNLVVGDFVAFTLSLFSTHRVGATLPQKHGVLLEIHLTKLSTGPDVFQLSHRLLVLPDSSTQVLIWQHHHTDPDHMMGAWEVSLDANGHLYHYWRRQLAHSTQSTPPNTPGPVQAYIATLMASLLADTDEKYGAMGFGIHYGISMESKFSFEFRWLSVTANSDIYDETPACPGTADPYGLVDTFDLPQEFFIASTGAPGIECCQAPDARDVGDILETDINGDPTVWVSRCCEWPDDAAVTKVSSGYVTNVSPECFPCADPVVDPVGGLIIFDLTGDWPEEGPTEGTIGKIVIHGIQNLPPVVDVSSTNLYFTVIEGVWLDYEELELKYEILPGGGGTDIDLTVTSAVDSARTLTVAVLDTIQAAVPTIESIDWIDTASYSLTAPTGGYQSRATISGVGFTGATLSTLSAGVTIDSFVIVGPTEISALITFDFALASGTTAILSVDSLGAGPGDISFVVDYPLPVAWNVDLSATTIGVGRTATIYGNFFPGPAPKTTVVAFDPTQITNLVLVSVTTTQIDVTFDIIAPGAFTTLLELIVTNVDAILSINVPICVIGNTTALGAISTVTPNPSPILTSDREPAASGYPPYSYDVVLTGMTDACWTYLIGPGVGPEYVTPGDSHTLGRTPGNIQGLFYNACGENMMVDVVVNKPGLGAVSALGAFSMADPPTPVTSGVPSFSVLPEIGVTGTVDFTFSSNTNYLTDIVSVSVAGITFTNRVDVGGGVFRYDFAIASTVAPATSVNVEFSNGECDLGTAVQTFTTEYVPPVITSVTGVKYEDVQGTIYTVKGTGFVTATVINVGGNGTYNSHVDDDPETITVDVDNGAPGAITFQVVNPDAKTSNIFPLTIITELAPAIDHVDMEPATTGVNATLFIYGSNLHPPGVVLAFTGFTAIGAPTYHNNSYIEQDGLITAPAAGDVEVDITSTSHSYTGNYLATAVAAPGGATIITSINNQFPVDNQTGFITTIFGQNMSPVDSIEIAPTTPNQLDLAYFPATGTPAAVVTIISKTDDHVTVSVDIGAGVAFNSINFLLYDSFLALLATAPSAITVQPSPAAPDMPLGTRALLDATIPTGLGLSWNVLVPMDWVFGDEILATGFTFDMPLPTYVGGAWAINGTNVGAPGENWQLVVNRPSASPERATYRVPGGETT